MADDDKCSAQVRRNEAEEFMELATTPNADFSKYGPIPMNSPAFACLSAHEKQQITNSIIDDKMSGKDAGAQIEDAHRVISGLPAMAAKPDSRQIHPLKKGQREL